MPARNCLNCASLLRSGKLTTYCRCVHGQVSTGKKSYFNASSSSLCSYSTAFISVLLSQPISHLDEGVQQQILLFIEQARDTKHDITPYGFFTLNNTTVFENKSMLEILFLFSKKDLGTHLQYQDRLSSHRMSLSN
ncbi:uncharacterized protein LOC142333092 isoform X2 [Lycorma delicatula]|uniref:uncharacterized protein LOC142333092 isoform X2 n=1 Tax=Lycorma delicatula TaxID=130591 RepID=UPI003F5115E0